MKWGDLKEIIGAAAPIVGTALGGPAGAAVGSLVSSALGVENNPQAVAKAIENDPEAHLKLKQLELDNAKDLRAKVLKMAEIELQDLQNARENHKHSIMPTIIFYALTAIAVCYGASLLFVDIPADNRDMINHFGGQLITLWVASCAYWIGTTRSSAEKTRSLMK